MVKDTKENIYLLELKEPFWGAGKVYDWEYPDIVGFGINRNILKENEQIIISTRGNEYLLERKDAREFYKKKPIMENHRGIELIIIPRAICKNI